MPRIRYQSDIDWERWLREKYALKGKEAETARMRAKAEMLGQQYLGRESVWRYGPRGVAREELARRFPYGIPEKEATTRRLNALHYGRIAGAAEREQWLREEEFAFARARGFSPREPVEEIKNIVAKPGYSICPDGYIWDESERRCVPVE